jgi:RNA recognition motif-containing protein
MGRKLFVGNFPYETGEAELEALFSQAGAIDTVRVMRDMSTGRARGFGFVEMATISAVGRSSSTKRGPSPPSLAAAAVAAKVHGAVQSRAGKPE